MKVELEVLNINEPFDGLKNSEPGFYRDGSGVVLLLPDRSVWYLGEVPVENWANSKGDEKEGATISEDFALKMLAVSNGQKLSNL